MKANALRGRTAVITGASSGIGRAVALKLAQNGCRIALAGRQQDTLDNVVSAVHRLGPEVSSTLDPCGEKAGETELSTFTGIVDVTSAGQVSDFFEKSQAALGHSDLVVCSAGLMYYGVMKNPRIEEWHNQVDVNCKGVLNVLAACVPRMVARRRGHIVVIGSDAGRRPFPGLAVYSGTKHFVEAVCSATRREVAPYGVRITVVQPGDVDTPLQTASTDTEAVKQYGGSTPDQMIQAEDIANAVCYALSQPPNVAVNEILIEPTCSPI